MLVYLDNSATTRQYAQVTEEMINIMNELYGNPSSLHKMGIEVEKKMKWARKTLASSIGALDEEIYITSCGTESDNWVVLGTANTKKRTGKKIITTKVEHPAVLEPCRRLETMGYQVEYVGVDKNCRLNLDELKSLIDDETILISVMGVNNETGTIMPIKEIARIKDEYNKAHGTDIWFHSDAVQAFGKEEINVNGNYNGVDFISASAHKIHGPKGMGMLYARKGKNLQPLILGGGQERHMRSGTENTPGIIGFAVAAGLAVDNLEERVSNMARAKEALLEGLKTEVKDIIINTPGGDESVASVLNVSFLGTRGEVILHTLEQDGIFVSTGSACSSNKKGQSHVLKAMGLKDKEIEGAIRFSLSQFNTVSEMEYVVEKVKNAVTRFRKLGSFR